METHSNIQTPNASRYLQQLCKHWAHKFELSFDPHHGRIDAGEGRIVTMQAGPDLLSVTVTAPDADSLARWSRVVEDHIRRFAFREELGFDWQQG